MTDNDRRLVSGWQGRYLEEFEIGEIYEYPTGRGDRDRRRPDGRPESTSATGTQPGALR